MCPGVPPPQSVMCIILSNQGVAVSVDKQNMSYCYNGILYAYHGKGHFWGRLPLTKQLKWDIAGHRRGGGGGGGLTIKNAATMGN